MRNPRFSEIIKQNNMIDIIIVSLVIIGWLYFCFKDAQNKSKSLEESYMRKIENLEKEVANLKYHLKYYQKQTQNLKEKYETNSTS